MARTHDRLASHSISNGALLCLLHSGLHLRCLPVSEQSFICPHGISNCSLCGPCFHDCVNRDPESDTAGDRDCVPGVSFSVSRSSASDTLPFLCSRFSYEAAWVVIVSLQRINDTQSQPTSF